MWIDSPKEPRPWGCLWGVGMLMCIAMFPMLCFVYMFRFDTTEEYYLALKCDIAFGAIFALGVLLVLTPTSKRPWQVDRFTGVFSVATSVALWIVISGGLLMHHYFTHKARFVAPHAQLHGDR